MNCPHCAATSTRKRAKKTTLGGTIFFCPPCRCPFNERTGTGCVPPTDRPEVGTAMGPHILMRGPSTSPNEPSEICSHGRGRGLQLLLKESDSSSASPVPPLSNTAKRVYLRMSGRGGWKRTRFGYHLGVPERSEHEMVPRWPPTSFKPQIGWEATLLLY